MDYTASFYSKPTYVGGGVVFSGARRQKGGRILGSLKSVVLPVLKTVGRKLGHIASKQALGLASGIVADAIAGKNVKQSLISRGKRTLLNTANEGLSSIGSLLATSTNNKRSGRPAKKKTNRSSTASTTANRRSSQRGSGRKRRRGTRKGGRRKKTRSRSRRRVRFSSTTSSRKRRHRSRSSSNGRAIKRKRVKNF